jgi:cell division protein FtsX
MKTIKLFSLLIAIVLSPVLMFGQNKNINKVIDKYQDNKSFTSVRVNPAAFEINPGENEKAQQADEMLQNIEDMIILKIDSKSKEYNKFIKEVEEAIIKDGFKEMIKVNDGNETVDIYIAKPDDESGSISDFIVFTKQDDDVSLIYINGIIALAEVMDVMGKLDVNVNAADEAEVEFEDEE